MLLQIYYKCTQCLKRRSVLCWGVNDHLPLQSALHLLLLHRSRQCPWNQLPPPHCPLRLRPWCRRLSLCCPKCHTQLSGRTFVSYKFGWVYVHVYLQLLGSVVQCGLLSQYKVFLLQWYTQIYPFSNMCVLTPIPFCTYMYVVHCITLLNSVYNAYSFSPNGKWSIVSCKKPTQLADGERIWKYMHLCNLTLYIVYTL